MSRLSTKQRRAARFRTIVARDSAAFGNGRVVLGYESIMRYRMDERTLARSGWKPLSTHCALELA